MYKEGISCRLPEVRRRNDASLYTTLNVYTSWPLGVIETARGYFVAIPITKLYNLCRS